MIVPFIVLDIDKTQDGDICSLDTVAQGCSPAVVTLHLFHIYTQNSLCDKSYLACVIKGEEILTLLCLKPVINFYHGQMHAFLMRYLAILIN